MEVDSLLENMRHLLVKDRSQEGSCRTTIVKDKWFQEIVKAIEEGLEVVGDVMENW